MRASRLLHLLLLLQNRGRMTAPALAAQSLTRFPQETIPQTDPDPRIPAIAEAIRQGRTLTLSARSTHPIRLTPDRLGCGPEGWWVSGPPLAAPIPQADWGDINISRLPVDIPPLPA